MSDFGQRFFAFIRGFAVGFMGEGTSCVDEVVFFYERFENNIGSKDVAFDVFRRTAMDDNKELGSTISGYDMEFTANNPAEMKAFLRGLTQAQAEKLKEILPTIDFV